MSFPLIEPGFWTHPREPFWRSPDAAYSFSSRDFSFSSILTAKTLLRLVLTTVRSQKMKNLSQKKKKRPTVFLPQSNLFLATKNIYCYLGIWLYWRHFGSTTILVTAWRRFSRKLNMMTKWPISVWIWIRCNLRSIIRIWIYKVAKWILSLKNFKTVKLFFCKTITILKTVLETIRIFLG